MAYFAVVYSATLQYHHIQLGSEPGKAMFIFKENLEEEKGVAQSLHQDVFQEFTNNKSILKHKLKLSWSLWGPPVSCLQNKASVSEISEVPAN